MRAFLCGRSKDVPPRGRGGAAHLQCVYIQGSVEDGEGAGQMGVAGGGVCDSMRGWCQGEKREGVNGKGRIIVRIENGVKFVT